jgi:hypothetical protein
LKFDGQIDTWLKKFKTKDQTGKSVSIGAKIDQIRGQIKKQYS